MLGKEGVTEGHLPPSALVVTSDTSRTAGIKVDVLGVKVLWPSFCHVVASLEKINLKMQTAGFFREHQIQPLGVESSEFQRFKLVQSSPSKHVFRIISLQ